MKARFVSLLALVFSRGTATKRNLAVGFAILAALSLILVNPPVDAQSVVTLPTVLVRMEVSNGTVSFFNTTLSNVPSGYIVTNGTYLGWCVDRTAEMARSPAIHTVRLYSSINPPGGLANEKWDMVNYILNHEQGTAWDIQQAIWYFINLDGNYTPTSTVAWAIVNDALANGTGFIPPYGQLIAIICFPVVLLPQPTSVQVSIIEINVRLFGDITGSNGLPDGRVNMKDIALIARHFGETVPPASPSMDIYPDGTINMNDIGIAAAHFGEHYP